MRNAGGWWYPWRETVKEVPVSEELHVDPEITDNAEAAEGEEFEEITSEEVDRVVGILEELIETVQSENVRSYLEDAMNGVYYLIYDEDDEEEDETMSEAA